ncbi:uncharacterized protein LOC141607641 [Silene latifolia]|uniref:uncharacterized protein LOC141607641 n=1 Tax=Silene latifolia TaxID=37657 RepID=UPI003D77E4F1
MIISSWNVRVMNDPLKQQEVLEFLKRNKVDCGAVIETHIKSNLAQVIYKRQFSSYSLATNYNSHPGGRIWLLWNPATVQVRVLDSSAQFLHCSLLHYSSQKHILLTVVYAFNRAQERIELWNALKSLSHGLIDPWVCVGDFNVSLRSEERVGCVLHDKEMQDFRDCLHSCVLEDHLYTGGVYTWQNNQVSSPKWAKLDRLLVNSSWFLQISGSSVAFLHSGVSDHSSILLNVAATHTIHKPFRYLNCWSLSPKFGDCVSSGWNTPASGNKIFSFFSKLRALRPVLKQLHSQDYTNLTSRVAAAKLKLQKCQQLLQDSPLNHALLLQEKHLLH